MTTNTPQAEWVVTHITCLTTGTLARIDAQDKAETVDVDV